MQASRNFYTENNLRGPDRIVDVQSIIKDQISTSPRAIVFSNQLATGKSACTIYARQYDQSLIRQEQRALQYRIMQQKTTDTPESAQSVGTSLFAPLNKTHQEIATVLKERDKYLSKWEMGQLLAKRNLFQ